MSISRKRVEKTVETVCRAGCEYVRQVIAELDKDETSDVPEMRELRLRQDRLEVLAELKEIMSVYDESAGGCCPLPQATPRASSKSGQAQA